MSQIWALHDSDSKNFPMVRIHIDQAKDYNCNGYGIFHTVQDFQGPRRTANLTRINAWAIDIDESPKAAQLATLKKGLVPSLVVESKRGYHAYWVAKDAQPRHYKAIVADRLVPFYGADTKACDLARILRMPGYYHLKDPTNPFMVRKVWEWPVSYSEFEMTKYYPLVPTTKRAEIIHNREKQTTPVSGNFWDRVWHLNCVDALIRLSGHPYVDGELYSFRRNAIGTQNIWVNNRSTSCWIDLEGRIGSLDGGGPTIYQWLNWFHKNPKRVVEMIKEVFPECL